MNKLDDFFITEVLGEIGIHLVLVDRVLGLFEQIRIMQRRLLELVRQYALVEQLVPVLDPGDAERAARHQTDHAWIGCAGTLSRLDQLVRMRSLFTFLDIAQPGYFVSSVFGLCYGC